MSEWISVEDALPGSFYDYLVCYKEGTVEQARFYGGEWILARTDSYDESIVVHPTHWQPLPDPPTT